MSFVSKDNSDFFKEKKDWSIVKDELLACYLSPYFAKIFHTRHAILYVDCFAGKGMFEDGNYGSPLIALNILRKTKEITNYPNAAVECVFIESVYAEELLKNIDTCLESNIQDVTVIPGKYEENIRELLEKKDGYNIFLYLDPFGVKSLQFPVFEEISKEKFYSLELLMNLNTFGFIRAACSAMNTKFDENCFEDVLGPETEMKEKPETLATTLTQIAGGDYWKDIIIQNRKNGEVDAYKAENLFAAEYCKQLSQHFRYVTNMSLRLKQGQHPKYRLVHATNHADGCLLMNNNMCKRKEIFQKESIKQKTLFPSDMNENIIDLDAIKEQLLEIIRLNEKGIEIKELYTQFIVKEGIKCHTNEMRDQLKKLEKERKIEVLRTPKITEKKKESTFWEAEKGKSILLKIK